jgi:uncharacterized protein YutD
MQTQRLTGHPTAMVGRRNHVLLVLCPEFQFDLIYEYATPALKVELRQLSQDEQSETEKLKQIVRLDDWLRECTSFGCFHLIIIATQSI